jgi:hypothetical protein
MLVSVLAVMLIVAAAAAQERGRGRGFGGFGGRGGPQSLVSLAAQESVQKDIGLGADLVGKVATLNDEYRASREKEVPALDFQSLRDLSEAERTAKMAEYTKKTAEATAKLDAEYTPKLQAIVGEGSIKRLKQIQIQSQGAAALTSAAVVTELKISDEQKKKLEDLNTEYQAKQRELFSAGGDQQERAAKQRELRAEQEKKAVEVLTAEQKEKFTALKGQAFDVSTLRGGRGRGNNN